MSDKKYKILMLATADVPEGWFDGRPFSCNQVIHARTPNETQAQVFTRSEAIHFMTARARGWPCKCVPPITVVY